MHVLSAYVIGGELQKTSAPYIEKTCLFKYTENSPPKNENFQIKNSDIFSYFCSKHVSEQK